MPKHFLALHTPLRKSIPILLAFVFIAQFVSKIVVIGYYHANKEYIAKNLCVNRANPESCCKGSCFLNDKLQKTEDTNNQKSPFMIKLVNESLFINNAILADCLDAIHYTIKENFIAYSHNYSYASYAAIFHPPNTLLV